MACYYAGRVILGLVKSIEGNRHPTEVRKKSVSYNFSRIHFLNIVRRKIDFFDVPQQLFCCKIFIIMPPVSKFIFPNLLFVKIATLWKVIIMLL